MLDTDYLLEFAHTLLHAAVPLLENNYTRLIEEAREGDIVKGDSVLWKAQQKKEIVTKGEQDAEKIMRNMVHNNFPEHDIAGEEWGYSITNSPYVWVFDPIDGTAAMLDAAIHAAHGTIPDSHHTPFFGITIGLLYEHTPILGIVHDPVRQYTWWGSVNNVTYCNGIAVSLPSVTPPLSNAILSCTAPTIMFSPPQRAIFDNFTAQLAHVMTNRNCIGFMQLLDGTIDMVWEGDLAFHDIVALLPILQQAGISVSDEQGHPFIFSADSYDKEYRVIAAHPALYEPLLNHSMHIITTDKKDTAHNEEGLYMRKF